jgi:hypothetical protein
LLSLLLLSGGIIAGIVLSQSKDPAKPATKSSVSTTNASGATIKPSVSTTNPSGATIKPSGSTTNPSGATTKPFGKNTDPIIIVGKNGTSRVTITDKDKFVNTNGTDQGEKGCWSLDSDPEWKANLKNGGSCAVTSITLPSDISATAWTVPLFGSWGGMCKNQQVTNDKGESFLAPGSTHTFKDSVCGFLFKKSLI